MRNAARLTLYLLAMWLTATMHAAAQGPEWPWLGVTVTDLAREDLAKLGAVNGGAYVTRVTPESPAGAAGLRRDDIIVDVNGKATSNVREFVCLLQGRKPGGVVVMTLFRNTKRREITATLARWPDGVDAFPPPLRDCDKDRVSAR